MYIFLCISLGFFIFFKVTLSSVEATPKFIETKINTKNTVNKWSRPWSNTKQGYCTINIEPARKNNTD